MQFIASYFHRIAKALCSYYIRDNECLTDQMPGPPRNRLTDGRTRECRLRRGPLGAYSAAIRIAQGIDGRTREGRLLIATRRALTAHLGGEDRLSAPQLALVERCSMLQLRIAALDARILDGSFTEYDAKTYLAFSNSLTRTMVALGLEPASTPQPSLSDVLADIAHCRCEPEDEETTA